MQKLEEFLKIRDNYMANQEKWATEQNPETFRKFKSFVQWDYFYFFTPYLCHICLLLHIVWEQKLKNTN